MKERQAYQTPTIRTVLLESEDVIATSSYDKGEEDIFSVVEAQQVWVD